MRRINVRLSVILGTAYLLINGGLSLGCLLSIGLVQCNGSLGASS
jgi:hypothetical protein